MRRILIFSKRCFKETLRDPLSLTFLFIVPVAMLILFYLAFHKLTSQFTINNLAPAMCGFGASFIGLFTASIIAEDRNSTFLTRLYTTPIKSYEFIIGYLVSLIPFSLMQGFLIFLTACLLDFNFFTFSIFIAILLNIIISLLFISFGILFGSLCNNKSVGGACSILIMGQSLLSGMWYPLEQMDKGFIDFLNVLPFKNCSDLMVNICNNSFDILKPLFIILGYTILVLVAAILCYRLKMKKK